jgi:2-polyprenyl-3-methyl-5-hydroxy-6-metoxy-1,4-benzoquinol methylase
MAEKTFWDHSWETVDARAMASYLARLDLSVDDTIRYLRKRGCRSVCDAGCGCGAYSLKLAANGFAVSGFDVSADAVALAKSLLSEKGCPAEDFFAADVCATGYADGRFDAVVSRSVLDHMPFRQAVAAVEELLRIVRPGGCVLLTLDASDEEYESERHTVNSDGDYVYTDGKWQGMVFHPYTPGEIERLTQGRGARLLCASETGFSVVLDAVSR